MPADTDIEAAFRAVHDRISGFLEAADGSACVEDAWRYECGSGGGISRVWEGPGLIEKGGANFSAIRGDTLPAAAAAPFQVPPSTPFTAMGVSLVIHPLNPHVPTVHMNIRYFEAGDRWWFGGGMDLTPYYPVREQVIAFHRALRKLCEEHGENYAAQKRACDDYFTIRHRGEMRGVGGIFFDHRREDKAEHLEFCEALGNAFPEIYGPMIDANRRLPYTEGQREFQLHRRSRYVEFNLIYDRGTLFGLQSGGRIESILMSMPPLARWRYNWEPKPGSPEAELVECYLKPRDWANENCEG
jgi:coproporphyrinogen III oxidase